MSRSAKTRTEQHASGHETPRSEPEEDRLLRAGLALFVASNSLGRKPTAEELERAQEEYAPCDLAATPADLRPILLALGKQDPRLFVEMARSKAGTLLALCRMRSNVDGEKVAEQLLADLQALELVLALRRYGGRPKGKRHKVTHEQVGTIRRWAAGDRSEIASDSVAGVAKKLRLSRQTVYTILKEIEEDRPE